MNLLICADSSKDTKTDRKQKEEEENNVMCQVSGVTCHMLPITCHLSPVTCHLSITPTATTADPPPANSPTIMHSRLVSKAPKFQNILKT